VSYYYARTVSLPFGEAITAVTDALGRHGFGVLSDIDVQATLKKKLGADTRPYRILGACNPSMAHRALQAEPLIGTMLPCNVVVRERNDGKVEVAAVDPVASMEAVRNAGLAEIAGQVRDMLQKAVDSAAA
jgi:uncharacterized protein (DUF302 family)